MRLAPISLARSPSEIPGAPDTKTSLTIVKTLFLVVVLASAATQAFARELPSAQPSRVGMSSERLQRLTDHMNQAVEDGVMVGGLGLIGRNGRVVYQETYGQRRSRSRQTNDDGQHFSYLLDEQTDNQRRRDDVVRGRTFSPQ